MQPWKAAGDGRHIRIPGTHVGDIDSILGPGLQCGPASASVGIWGVKQLVEDPISVSLSLSVFCLFFSFISLPFKQNVEINKKPKKKKKKEPGQGRKQRGTGPQDLWRQSGGCCGTPILSVLPKETQQKKNAMGHSRRHFLSMLCGFF